MSRLSNFLLLAVALLTAPTPAAAATFYVSAAAGDDATGDGSATLPWRTFSHALAQALVEGDEIIAAAGSYDLASGEAFPLVVPQGVSVRGSTSGDTVITAGTMPPFPSELIRAAVGTQILPSPSTIERLVLLGSGGAATGVLLLADKGAGPVLSHCRFSGFGRAIAVDYVVSGGPDQQVDSRPFVNACLLAYNTVAVDINIALAGTPGRVRERSELHNNFIHHNQTAVRIRASCSGCDPAGVDLGNTLLNNTLAANGEGVVLENSDCSGQFATNSPQIQNNILAFHTGHSLLVDACSVPNTVDHNVFWQNALGGDGDALSNLITDPLLRDASAGDLHLLAGSPAIDAGLDFVDVAGDYDGDTRPLDGNGDGSKLSDIGGDEYAVAPLALRRANFLGLAPLSPAMDLVFPMFPANPFTTLVTANLASGDSDAAGILDQAGIPMAFYAHDGGSAPVLLCRKDLAQKTVSFDLR